jgi:two-component system chemotaxis response regulator CheB
VTAREIVMIGVSAGGLTAVTTMLRGLPESFLLPLVVIQHRSRDSILLCDLLQGASRLEVREVVDKESIQKGRVYIAPPDYHLLVEQGHFALSCDAPEAFSRPSIDLSFETAAYSFGAAVVGIVLTGANADGAAGLRRIAARGGLAIVQDPASAEVPVMPSAALAAVPQAEVLPLGEIATRLSRIPGALAERTERSA